MSFAKASVKRFNEELNDAPAPNAYDAKMPQKKISAVSLAKDNLPRFQEPKDIGPGPGQYLANSSHTLGAKSKSGRLLRSASFRNRSQMGSRTDLSTTKNDRGFKTPCSTPSRPPKLRRSVSSGDLSPTHLADLSGVSPIKTMQNDEDGDDDGEEKEVSIRTGLVLEQAMAKLKLQEEKEKAKEEAEQAKARVSELEDKISQQVEEEKSKVEKLEAELSTARQELLLKEAEVEEAVRMKEAAERREELVASEISVAASLRGEVVLLQQDNRSLEDHLEVSRQIRDELEGQLEQSRKVREELQSKVKEEDAKAVFLHFTQEQLNSQVVSLEEIVKNLKVENQLLNKAIQKLVVCVNEEKDKLAEEKEKLEEVTAQYNLENADSEKEFKSLETKLAAVTASAKEQEMELRAQLGQAEVNRQQLLAQNEKLVVEKQELELVNEELRNDVEVAENDRTVLKDSLVEVESERTKLTLDLGEVSQQKMLVEGQILQLEQKVEEVRREAQHEVTEAEMSSAALQGELSALREEVEAGEQQVEALKQEVVASTAAHAYLLAQYEEQAALLTKMEELRSLNEEKQAKLEQEVKENEGHLEASRELREELEGRLDELRSLSNAKHLKVEQELVDKKAELEVVVARLEAQGEELQDTQEKLQEMEEELEVKKQEVQEAKIGREEVEESLLDTQGLVEAMEDKLQEADNKHRQEVADMEAKLRRMEAAKEQITGERATLLEMNTALSGQVTDSLNSIHELQGREVELGREVALLRGFMEAAQEEGEADRVKIFQAEDEILSLQAEIETVLMEREEAGRSATRWAEAADEAQQKVQQLEGQREDLNAQLDTLKSAYNAAVGELADGKNVGRELLERLNLLEAELEVKKNENERLLKDFEDKNQEALDHMMKARETFEGEQKLMQENVKHLELLRNNLEASLSAKEQVVREKETEVEEAEKKLLIATSKSEEVSKNNLRLKGNLELRAEEAAKLKEEIKNIKDSMGTDIRRREASLERAKADCRELAADKAEVEALRRKELEMVVDLREQLEQKKESEEREESALRSMEAQQRLLQEAETRVEEFKTALERWQTKFAEAEEVMKAMEGEREAIENEKDDLERQFEALKLMVEPYRDQLESFEMERRALLAQNEVAEGEAKKLAVQNGRLLGHQNHSQKIQHVVKIKQENVQLKTEVTRLTEELLKSKRQLGKAEDRLAEAQGIKRFDPRMSFQPKTDKENSMVTPAKSKAVMPAPSSARPSRHSTGSPLRVNRT